MATESVLKPLDININTSPTRKRARHDEEIPSNKQLKFNEIKYINNVQEYVRHGVGRLDQETDNSSSDEDTVFEKHKGNELCPSVSPTMKNKRIEMLQSVLSKDTIQKLTQGNWEEFLLKKDHLLCCNNLNNYFELLADEIILQIFRWLPKKDLINLSFVCKRFNRLYEDESLWTRMDISNSTIAAGGFGPILTRQMIILRCSKSNITYPPVLPTHKAASPDFSCRLLYLDLSMCNISPESLTVIFNRCKRLKKLSLENVPVNDNVLIALSASRDIEVVNFAMVTGIQECGLKYFLTNCRKIRELNIAWTYLNRSSIAYICANLPASLDRLNMSGCRKLLNDKNIADLVVNCPHLRELDLSDCTFLTGEAIRQITVLEELNFLSLSRCYLIDCNHLLQLKKIKSLQYLDIHGGYIQPNELVLIKSVLGSQVTINKFRFSSIARPTVGLRRSSIWNMRVRD